jgi:hypothetical protein
MEADMASPDTKQKVEDGTFLAEEFGIPANKAAELVSQPGEADQVEAGVQSNLRAADPLEGVPTPKAGPDFSADTDEIRLKPVLHEKNNRAGAG